MTTEADRIKQYQAGFNDYMAGRRADPEATLFYAIGWKDAHAGRDPRIGAK
jgi:hypothetical protein